jgi:hypothetical protein
VARTTPPLRLDGQQRADERIELRVDEHHGLALLECVERDARREIDAARDLDDQVDRAALEQHRRIVREHRRAARDARLRLGGGVHGLPLCDTGLAEGSLPVRGGTVRDSGEPHAGDRCAELQRDRAAGGAGADHADADRLARGLAIRENRIEGIVRIVAGEIVHFIPLSRRPAANSYLVRTPR